MPQHSREAIPVNLRLTRERDRSRIRCLRKRHWRRHCPEMHQEVRLGGAPRRRAKQPSNWPAAQHRWSPSTPHDVRRSSPPQLLPTSRTSGMADYGSVIVSHCHIHVHLPPYRCVPKHTGSYSFHPKNVPDDKSSTFLGDRSVTFLTCTEALCRLRHNANFSRPCQVVRHETARNRNASAGTSESGSRSPRQPPRTPRPFDAHPAHPHAPPRRFVRPPPAPPPAPVTGAPGCRWRTRDAGAAAR